MTSVAAEAQPPALRIEGLGLTIGGLRILRSVDLSVAARDVAAVIGPNGAGKTSLFNCISQPGLADHASINFQGIELRDRSSHQVTRLGISRTFQHPVLFAGMTVRENIALGAGLRNQVGYFSSLFRPGRVRSHDRRTDAEVQRIIELVELTNVADLVATSLPAGLQRFAELGRALAFAPKLLLLDEPVAGLNNVETKRYAGILERVRVEAACSILVIEHDLSFVMSIASQITVLNFGEVIARGTPDEVRANPEVVAAYLGEPAGTAGE